MMSLVRQVWLLLFGVLSFALVASVATHTLMARQSLRTQLQVRNDDGAMMLALALSQQRGDEALMALVAAAQFDTGHYHALRLLREDGSVLFERERHADLGAAPAWFVDWLPLQVGPGEAAVSNGWKPVGRVQLSSQVAWASDALWTGSLRMAGWLTLLGMVAAAVAALAVRSWRRPLEAAVMQAQALQERRFVLAEEPRVPELRRLTRSMNSLVRRLQATFETQALQLDELQAQAHRDAVTALPNRRRFIADLGVALAAERHRGAGLLLVRLRRLQAMNQRIGHDATDRVLGALAQVLRSYPRHVKGALAGRLNGSDFALYLPASGMAAETAQSLVEALRAALATVDTGADLVVGGADLPQTGDAANALSLADEALARAEGLGPFSVQVVPALDPGVHVPGQGEWRERIAEALREGRCELAEFAVQDAAGTLLHLDCPMRLRLAPQFEPQPASHWLAMAVRCGLIAQIDAAGVAMALGAIARDGLPRSINIAAASLATPGFVRELHQRLLAAPDAAALLWIDFAEGATLQVQRVQEAATQWRPLGVHLGLEHAGAALRDLARLHTLGVDYVKIDAALLQGVASQPAVREVARGLVTLLRGMEVKILAERVDRAEDLAALWALGFDGATGAALGAPGG